jgi:YHS domain-containing protein
MTRAVVVTWIAAMLAVVTVGSLAQGAAKAPAPSKPQTTCLVSGQPIDKTHYLDYEGQRIYFCCDKCPAKFKADPEKYFEKAAKDGVLLENVQTTCPVGGEKLESKDTFVDYKGRRVYFCCPKCIKPFEKEPAKYLSKLTAGESVTKAEATRPAAPAAKTVYVCTMCNITSDKPGKCPKCGMNLVPKTSS